MVENSNDPVGNQSFEGQDPRELEVRSQADPSSLSQDLRSKLAWLIYFLLPVMLLICGVGHGYQVGLVNSNGPVSGFWLFTFGIAVFSIAIVAAIWLALMGDVLPHRRLIAFIALTIVFSVSTFGISYIVSYFEGVSREGDWVSMDFAFYVVSIAWWVWCMRIYRGWRITKDTITDREAEVEPRAPEYRMLAASVLFALVPFLVYHSMFVTAEHLTSYLPLAFVALSSFGALIVLPITFWMMRTRWPFILGLALFVGLPAIFSIGVMIYFLPLYSQLGELFPVEAQQSAIWIGLFCFFPIIFFWALRLDGYRLVVPRIKPAKVELGAAKPHPLDD